MHWISRNAQGLIMAAGNTTLKPAGSDVFEVSGSYVTSDTLIKNYYHNGVELLPKQHFTIDAIPLPATAEIEGEQYPITANPAVFTFDTPGTYTVQIDAGPAYYIEEFTIDYPA